MGGRTIDDGGVGGSAAVAMVGRSELRQRWVVVVAVGLLLGVAGGVGIGCLAGARRTSTLFHRHLATSQAPDLEIDPGSATPAADRAIRTLPGVVDASYWVVTSAFPLNGKGGVDLRFRDLIAFTTDGRYIDRDKVALARGRRLDPARTDEVMVNQSFVRVTGLHVGDRFPLGFFASDGDGVPLHPDHPDKTLQVRIVGVMVLNEEIASEALDVIPRMFVSPALKDRDPSDRRKYGYAWYALQLAPGTSAASVEQRWGKLAAAHNAHLPQGEEGWLTYVHRATDLERKASRAVRPLVTTVAAFGLATLLAAIVLAAQSLSREVRTRREVIAVGRILGLTPTQAFAASMAVPALALVGAVLVGLATAALVSLAFPIGPFKVLEPSPGLDLDVGTVAPLLVVLGVLPLALVVLTAVRSLRGGSLSAGDPVRRPSRLAALAARSGRSPSWPAALRLTFEPGSGQSYVPTRSVQVSSIIAVAALATIMVFGHNLESLDRDPGRFGWNADGGMASDGGYSPFDATKLGPFLRTTPDITRWQLAATGQVLVRGEKIPGVAFGPGDRRLRPTMVGGRPPGRRGEVVLGAETLRSLHASIGDRITIGAGARRETVRITGTAVFPVLGPVLAVRTGLDSGVWLADQDFLQLDSVVGYVGYGLPANSIYNIVLLGLRPGTSIARLQDRARRVPKLSFGSSVDVVDVIRPSEVRTAAAAGGRSQALLAGVLGLSAGLSILFALSAVVRRRRSELAVYRVLGFTPGQVRRTLLLQGVILLGISVLIGIPLGVGLGRTLWRAFAGRLGVVPDPLVPVPLIGALALAALLVGVLGSLGPAVAAARVAPAVAVRAE